MFTAFCRSLNREISIDEYLQTDVDLRREYAQGLICPGNGCHQPVWVKGESSIHRQPHFCARHAVDCGNKTINSPSKTSEIIVRVSPSKCCPELLDFTIQDEYGATAEGENSYYRSGDVTAIDAQGAVADVKTLRGLLNSIIRHGGDKDPLFQDRIIRFDYAGETYRDAVSNICYEVGEAKALPVDYPRIFWGKVVSVGVGYAGIFFNTEQGAFMFVDDYLARAINQGNGFVQSDSPRLTKRFAGQYVIAISTQDNFGRWDNPIKGVRITTNTPALIVRYKTV